jgi:hypothetical protein
MFFLAKFHTLVKKSKPWQIQQKVFSDFKFFLPYLEGKKAKSRHI